MQNFHKSYNFFVKYVQLCPVYGYVLSDTSEIGAFLPRSPNFWHIRRDFRNFCVDKHGQRVYNIYVYL